MFGYDRNRDTNRSNPVVHYRLYFSARDAEVVVICVQDFDYNDYDDEGFIGYEAYETESAAQLALAGLRAVFGARRGGTE
jgi:hypothetical protein